MVELSRAIHKAKNSKSAGNMCCPAECFKALLVDLSTKASLLEVVNAYWRSGSFPDDFAEPTMRLARANSCSWISWQQANPKTPGSASRVRYYTSDWLLGR